MRVRALTAAGLSLSVLAALTGCTDASSSEGLSSTATTVSAPSTAPGTPSSSEPSATVSLEPVQRFRLSHRHVRGIASTPTAVFVAASPAGAFSPNQVRRLGLASGDQSVEARSRWAKGVISGLEVTGHWLVWVDQSDELSTGGPGGSITVLWRLWAKNLRSGRRVLLATNGSTPDPLPPDLVTGDGYVGWTLMTFQTVRSFVWKPGWARPRALTLPGKAYGPSAFTDGKVIFLRYAKTKLARRHGLGDCWSYPVTGKGRLVQLTHSGLAQGCGVAGSDLVWTEHIDPAAHDSTTVRHAADDPYELKAVSLDGAGQPPRTIHEGTMSASPVLGDGFVLWFPFGPAQVSALDSSASTTFRGGGLAWWAATHGNLVAYPREGKKSTTVTVVRVVMSGP